jgi:hypothetical protein
MAESFGARLRQQRQRQAIPLTSIADETKISLSLLEGLERDDMSHWPAGIFRRSFIRAYAQMVGLEHDPVVREFLELYPDPLDANSLAPLGGDGDSESQRPPTRLQYLVGSAIGSLRRRPPQVVELRGPITETAPEGPASSMAAAREPTPTVKPANHWEPDLSAVAHLCTELGRVMEAGEVGQLLEGAAAVLDASGVIVWLWDPQAAALKPALAHGYSNGVLAKLPGVRRDADNATAAAFRSAQTRVVHGHELANGAVVVPLMTPTGCGGVLAVELRHGGEQRESVRALVTIFAAQLASVVGAAPLAEAVNI